VQVSVIIPTLNEEEFIKPCLESLSFIDPDEVIVVDGRSRDRTVEIAKSFGQKLFPLNEEEGNSFPLGQNWLKGIISFFFTPIVSLQSP
jgi:glycosyltransferase involved in cell wall biosynthesis